MPAAGRVIVLAVVTAAVTTGVAGVSSEALLKKYTHMKVMAGCLGQVTVLRWRNQLRAASRKCQGDDPLDITPDFTYVMDDLKKMLYRPPPLLPISHYLQSQYQVPQYPQQYLQNPQVAAQYDLLSRYHQQLPSLYGFSPLYNPLQTLAGYRTKRQAEMDPEKVSSLRDEITARISNITCVLREMKMLDSENQPNYAYVSQEVMNLPVSEELKGELREAVEGCRDFSRCLPEGRSKEPLSKELGTAMAFMKCMSLRMVLVCMRADLRKFASDSELPDLLLPGLASRIALHPAPLATQVEDLMFGETDPIMLL